MPSATRTEVPVPSLLHALAQCGSYTDCYYVDVPLPVSHAAFVRAFYTTPLFKAERLVLRWVVNRPSTDEQAHAVATGRTNAFAAWRVVDRSEDEILLTDESGRTSSWLKVVPLASPERSARKAAGVGDATRLLFGSAIRPQVGASGERKLGWVFRTLLGAHDFYSRRLLEAAAARLLRG